MEGEEVTINYGHKKEGLKRFYGFECMCGGCVEEHSEGKVEEGIENVVEREEGEGGRTLQTHNYNRQKEKHG
jgi:hypothetical protein